MNRDKGVHVYESSVRRAQGRGIMGCAVGMTDGFEESQVVPQGPLLSPFFLVGDAFLNNFFY